MHERRDVLRGIGAAGIAAVGGLGTAGTVLADDHDGEESARVRVAHKSPDAPAVDVFLGGDEVLSGVPFGAVSDYLSVAPGSYDARITAADDPDTVAFDGEVSVESGTDYTVAAIGELTSDDTAFRPLVFRDINREYSENLAIVRGVHTSPDAPTVQVTVDDGAYTLYDHFSFGDVGQSYFVPAREYSVEVRPEGGGDPVAQTDVSFEGGKTFTLFAEGYLSPDDEPTSEAFALSPAVSAPREEGDDEDESDDEETPPAALRVAHASPDAPAVDVFLGGDRVLSGVSFGTISDYLSVAPGSYQVKITAAGDPDTVAFDGEVSVEAGTDYTVAAIGELTSDDTTFQPLILTDEGSAANGRSDVRVVHASPDAPAVDVTVDDAATTLVDGLAFGEATGYATVKPGRKELEVRPDSASNDNPFDAEFAAQVRPGQAYTALATGYFTADDEPTDESFDLLLAADGSDEH